MSEEFFLKIAKEQLEQATSNDCYESGWWMRFNKEIPELGVQTEDILRDMKPDQYPTSNFFLNSNENEKKKLWPKLFYEIAEDAAYYEGDIPTYYIYLINNGFEERYAIGCSQNMESDPTKLLEGYEEWVEHISDNYENAKKYLLNQGVLAIDFTNNHDVIFWGDKICYESSQERITNEKGYIFH